MRFLDDCRGVLALLAGLLTFQPINDGLDIQHPLGNGLDHPAFAPEAGPPDFKAPNGPHHGDPFICRYPKMKGWKSCSTPNDRSCWLKGPHGKKFDIHTDYETQWPEGTVREYVLDVDHMKIDGDGVVNPYGKVFNKTYPGPWIKACWGDTIRVKVRNHLKYNGTTIHWHGIRQLHAMEMDGVNGVTQCPIAPGDEFTYEFKAVQYGSTWYHSHYSLQYADGLAGPITIFGPSSEDYDDVRDPLLMTDWNHRSAFMDFQQELDPSKAGPPAMNSILLNGIGNYAGADPTGHKYELTFKKGKKYLMRIINTSVDTTFIFTIDNHNLTIISSDFVPIKPYNASHIVVGIGQRYHVVVHANPLNDDRPESEHNYWIRTIPADGCSTFENGNQPDERQGILHYDRATKTFPTTARTTMDTACRDEHYHELIPIVPWKIDKFANEEETKKAFDVDLAPAPGHPQPSDRFRRWHIGDRPLYINFADPTILNLDNTTWNPDYVVIPEDYGDGDWVFLAISGATDPNLRAAHPIHLHGHDFALLAQVSNAPFNPTNLTLNLNNPPRRDVALLPASGYLVIAFKADNPGSWLLHCHIAWHASSGLALQVLERQRAAAAMLYRNPRRLAETRRVCRRWGEWFADPRNLWNPDDVRAFQDDSGI